MKLEDFKENCDGLPETLDYFAREASTVVDCSELQAAAVAYNQAEYDFLNALTDADVEIG